MEWRVSTRSSRPRRGLSLLEAVVSIAIVGMTAVSALEAVGAGMRSAEKARRATEAEALATSRMDLLDLLTDRELQALPDSVKAGEFPGPLSEYSWETTSQALIDPPGIYDIHITISWKTGSYLIRTYQYRAPRVVTRR
jgi:type II secretory pathway pseudopilin PulG